MIRNIIFDMGNVLRRFEPELCIRHYAADANDAALLNQVVFGSAEWLMLDRGTITYEEAENRWAARLPEHLQMRISISIGLIMLEMFMFGWRNAYRTKRT